MGAAHYPTKAQHLDAGSALGPRIGVACAAGALVLALFYHGPQVPLLAAAELLLVAWLAASLASRALDGVPIPLTPVSITLSLFWLWLGVSLLWSTVPATSVVSFWWVGSFALAFWAYTLAPRRDAVWRQLARLAPAGALALCACALVQVFLLGEPPRATFVNIHSFAALLMLVALPLGAQFLCEWHRAAGSPRLYACGALLFVVCFVIALTEGRGTALSAAFGLALLALLARGAVRGASLAVLLALALGAYAAANLILHGNLSDVRLATLADPASAGSTRFLIWRGSWELLMQEPWWGIGLGAYYLAWPPYRHPEDSSLGFFVHNDYLQIWIEAGLPALLLLLAVFVAVLVLLARALRSGKLMVDARLEAAGLVAGLFAVAGHSFLDFNFYVLPISIGAGLVLARFHELACAAPGARALTLRPARLLEPRVYRLVVVLLALFPTAYFVALGLSDHLYKRGFHLALAGELQQADKALRRAARLLPGDDKVLVMHADLYRHALVQVRDAHRDERRALLDEALELLARAESANPYRALVHSVRGRLLYENRDLIGDDWRARAARAYRQALARDPRDVDARVAYAELLLESGQAQQAMKVLTRGSAYWYYPTEAVLAYYERTARLARALGDESRAIGLERRIASTRAGMERLAPARPVVPELALPAVAD